MKTHVLRKVFCLLVGCLCMHALTVAGAAATLYVGPGQTYTTIQSAVTAAGTGDTIIVKDSTYTENVTVDKRLTIQSENGNATTTVVAASFNDHVFYVTADYVRIEGFTIYGATATGKAGVHFQNVDYGMISNNRCGYDDTHRNAIGIDLFDSDHNTVSDNTCNSNDETGIKLDQSSRNTISGNSCSNSSFGIHLLENSTHNTLSDNICTSNSSYGVYLSNSAQNTLSGNTCGPDNDNGIRLFSSYENTLSNNTCNDNMQGIFVFNASDHNVVSNNTCSNNSIGIYLQLSNNNTVSGNTCMSNNLRGIGISSASSNTFVANTLSSNQFAIHISDTSDNVFYLNNLSENSNTNVYGSGTNSNTWHSPTVMLYDYTGGSFHRGYLGNYYDDRIGHDDDRDGIASEPYIIGGDANDDTYPLWTSSDRYGLEAWWLHNDRRMYKADAGKPVGSGSVTPKPVFWFADQAAARSIRYRDGDAWTGQMTFIKAPETGHSFTVEVGYVEVQYGHVYVFVAGGPQATLHGDDIKTVFTYEASAGAFTLPAGAYPAIQIISQSGEPYEVRTGGAWSYVTSASMAQTAIIPALLLLDN